MQTNRAKVYLLCLFLYALFPFFITARPKVLSYYYIQNISGEDLLITICYSDDAYRLADSMGMHRLWEDTNKKLLPSQYIGTYQNTWILFRCEPEIRQEKGTDGYLQTTYNEATLAEKTLKLWIYELNLYDL
jgi:hypothetical protein